MPIGEIETHPYLHQGLIQGATNLILGSFPVYECTNHDSLQKQEKRLIEGTVRFFYGSARSSFWSLYRAYIDEAIILPPEPNVLLQSLADRRIAISDVIQSCERIDYSSQDSDLRSKVFNGESIFSLINHGVRKILCTSKGVLNDLERRVVCNGNPPFAEVNAILSSEFQNNFLMNIEGNINNVAGPIAKVFTVNDFQIEALAIPSPGSPQRQLATFGYDRHGNWREYADIYFQNAFEWLVDDY